MSVRGPRFLPAGADLDEVRGRTRWTMTASVVAHALLFAFIVLHKPTAQASPELTEITLLGPGDLQPAASAASEPARASVRSTGATVSSHTDESFRRESDQADVSPDAQAISAADRVSARLAAMREDVSVPVAGVSSAIAPSSMWTTPAGSPSGTGTVGRTINLTRGGSGDGTAPVLLSRGGGDGLAPALAQAGGTQVVSAVPASAPEGDSHARRTLAGAQLAGPIADRAVLEHITPEYPEWAKRDGVEAAVTLYFVVRPDGSVKENILVQKTAGFGDFDDSARAALAAWRFAPLGGGRTVEQWGTITFHFRLHDV
jgi:TonB family protein